MFGVELLGHGRDAAAGDGLLAARAEGAAPLVVVALAVRLAVVLEEAAVDERSEALLRKGWDKAVVKQWGLPSPKPYLPLKVAE